MDEVPADLPTDLPTDLAEHLEIRRGRARLAATRRGSGPRHMVFLHSGVTDRRSWDGVMDLLSPGTDALAYDRRGFGTTAYKPERHDQVADLLAVLDVLDGPGPPRTVLVGNSRGGQIALDAALLHPGRFPALVLVAPAVSGAPAVDNSEIDAATAAIWANLEAADAAGALDALNIGEIRLWLDGPAAPEGRVDGPRRQLALDMNRIALHAESPGPEPDPPDTWSRLSEVTCPVLVVAGDLDLPHIQQNCAYLADHLPGGQLVVMEGTAHLPAFEQPERFVAVVEDFLSRHQL
ncbi:MAG TPA: alpha/beta hydrolase [Acidimicrobiales bacterium]|nr:alpha/beta hydrolase [Acidimicrobiales bacterium]